MRPKKGRNGKRISIQTESKSLTNTQWIPWIFPIVCCVFRLLLHSKRPKHKIKYICNCYYYSCCFFYAWNAVCSAVYLSFALSAPTLTLTSIQYIRTVNIHTHGRLTNKHTDAHMYKLKCKSSENASPNNMHTHTLSQ